MNIISQIINRQSVHASNQQVCRAVIEAMIGGMDTFLDRPRAFRRVFLSEVIRRANRNRDIYNYAIKE